VILATIDVTVLLVALMGGGLFSGIVALLKFKPEKDAVVVSAAQGAVIVQSGVIDALQEELRRAREERDESRREAEVERGLRIAAEARLRELEAK
jgi:hypothetical protein